MRLRAIQEAERILLGRLQDPPPGHFTLDASCELLGLDRQWLLDARRDLARTEAVLRQAGLRRGRRGPRGRPQSGWPSLSPAERAVASLVADGLTNPQIGDRLYISRRTVQTHLVHIFAKLDIASRAQLAAEVTRHQWEPSPALTHGLATDL